MSNCSPWTYVTPNPGPGNAMSMQICAKNKGSDVEANLTQYGYPTASRGYKTYWRMELLAKKPSESGWKAIGTRTGYVGVDSPSKRIFTNVKSLPMRKMKVKVVFTEGLQSGSTKVIYSKEFLRY